MLENVAASSAMLHPARFSSSRAPCLWHNFPERIFVFKIKARFLLGKFTVSPVSPRELAAGEMGRGFASKPASISPSSADRGGGLTDAGVPRRRTRGVGFAGLNPVRHEPGHGTDILGGLGLERTAALEHLAVLPDPGVGPVRPDFAGIAPGVDGEEPRGDRRGDFPA